MVDNFSHFLATSGEIYLVLIKKRVYKCISQYQKYKNVEPQQNLSGSYKKKCISV